MLLGLLHVFLWMAVYLEDYIADLEINMDMNYLN